MNKNLTVTLSEELMKKLDDLVEYYQINSITKITKTDVVRHLIEEKRKELDLEISSNRS